MMIRDLRREMTLVSLVPCVALLLAMVVPAPVSADVWGHWPLNDGEGDTAADLGPQGSHGEIWNYDIGGLGPNGSVWFDDPDRGMVISFAGGGSLGAYVFAGFMPDQLTLEPDSDFTWAFWARQDEFQPSPSNVIILGNRWGPSGGDTSPREFIKFTPNRFEYHMNAGVAIVTNPDGTEQFLDDLQYLDCDFCIERHIPSDPSEWLHHAVVKDGDRLTYYRNGEEWNTRTIETDQHSAQPLPIFFGGADQGGGVAAETWMGYMSDVWLYDEALTAQRILEVMGGAAPGVPGDFNGDGLLTAADIDDLTAQSASGTNPATYDLNADALVNASDVNVWVTELFNSWIGDANLDGEFNSSDLVVVLASGTYEVAVNSVWSSGDFNGDGLTNSSDLVAALAGGGYELGPRAAVAAVPEPSGLVLLVLGALGLVARRRTGAKG